MQNFEKAFLRTCINQSCMPIDRTETILQSICEAYGVDCPPDVKELVTNINDQLSPYNQQLTFFKHPLYDGPEFLVFGFTFETDACKRQMQYSDADRHYFLKLIEATVKEEDFGILWSAIYNVVGHSVAVDKKLPKQRMQELAQKWTKQGYYLQKKDKLYLGPRMLVEYGNHLKRNFAELLADCPLCNKLVMWDIKCGDCGTKLHRECIRKYLIRKSNCPSCKKTWNTRLSLSE